MDNYYKLKQLHTMLTIEEGQKGIENAGFGAHLTHWFGVAPIQLDADAIKALIRHYEVFEDREQIRVTEQGGVVEYVGGGDYEETAE